ncbi:MAG: hypothetical protein J5775_05450 [Spirochaetales bacterium]|nr:hypothetical protein [Spirochaetales bacterium]
MKKTLLVLITVVALIALVSCASSKKQAAIVLTTGGASMECDSIEAAVAGIPAGGEGTIVLSADATILTPIVIGDKSVTITDNGKPVVITDGLVDADNPNFLFTIYGTGKVVINATAKGNITMQGASDGLKRCMFNVGPQNGDFGDKSPNAILEMTNVTVQGISTTYTGGVARGYGTMTFNDCTIRDNATTVNGTFLCMYGKVTINGGEFINNSNTFSNGGLIQVTNTDGIELTVNGGYFSGNSGVWGACINTYAKSKATIIGATFENNTAVDAEGAAVRTQGTTVIKDCTFIGNAPYDITVKAGNCTIDESVKAEKVLK